MTSHPRLVTIIDGLQQPAKSVCIALGELFPLSEDELRTQWKQATKSKSLGQAKLDIHMIRAVQQCMVCFEKYHPVNKETFCPHCGSVGAKILSGEEFYLESFEAMDE